VFLENVTISLHKVFYRHIELEAVGYSAGLGDREIAGSNLSRSYCAPKTTQPSIPPCDGGNGVLWQIINVV